MPAAIGSRYAPQHGGTSYGWRMQGGGGGMGGMPQVGGGFGGFGAVPQVGGGGAMDIGWRGGAGGAAPTFPGGGAQASIDYAPAQQYDPYGGGSQLAGNLQQMAEYGQGLMDPQSQYYQQLQAAMTTQLGQQSEAQQRAAALRSAYSGFGAGAGAEQMMSVADIGRAGMEAQGQAAAGLALQAPMAGAGMVQGTFGPGLGLEQLGERSRQFGAGMAEQSRQFGAGVGLQQQQLAAQQAAQQAQMQQQAQMVNQQAALQQQQLMAQMAMNYGGF